MLFKHNGNHLNAFSCKSVDMKKKFINLGSYYLVNVYCFQGKFLIEPDSYKTQVLSINFQFINLGSYHLVNVYYFPGKILIEPDLYKAQVLSINFQFNYPCGAAYPPAHKTFYRIK